MKLGARSPVAEYFGRLAANYGDGAYSRRRRTAVLDAIADSIARADAILDLGCGNGTYLAEFARANASARCVGADLTDEMLREAQRRIPPRCELASADATRLPFRGLSFDLIFASHVLPFVAHFDDAIVEIARTLKVGGTVVATHHGGGNSTIRSQLSDIVGTERWNEFASLMLIAAPRESRAASDAARYRDSFMRAGLETEHRVAPFTIDFADVIEWIEIRWMPMIASEDRERGREMIAGIEKTVGATQFTLEESLTLGHKRG
jgi:ubiquinone/menaquinone biosynthesis C-methylase UbiE